MDIRVLGCSGAVAAGDRTTSFLIDDDLLVDAGTGVGDLTLDQMSAVDHILITHSHLDHVLGIGLMADSVMRRRIARGAGPVRVHALPATLDALRQHIFNGVIWPDFTVLPSAQAPAVSLVPIAVGQVLPFGRRRVEVLPASHTVPAVGYAVWPDESAAAWVYTGDTGPNPALWARLATLSVAALVIETAFGNDEQRLADLSRHLSPRTLALELRQLGGSVDVLITHIKPGEVDAVMREVAGHGTPHRVRALVTGERLHLKE